MTFNIYDETTWNLASDSILKLNGKSFFRDQNGEEFTEKGLVKAIDDIIRGFSSSEDGRKDVERVGRQRIIAHLINYMDKGKAFNDSIEELVHWMCNETFDILNLDTWDYAGSDLMLWNGKHFIINEISSEPCSENLVKHLCIKVIKTMAEIFSEEKVNAFGTMNIIKYFLDETVSGTSYTQVFQEISIMIKHGIINKNTAREFLKELNQKNQITQTIDKEINTNTTDSSPDLTPPPYTGVVIGIALLIFGIILLFSSAGSTSQVVFGLLMILLSIIPFAMYSSAKSKFYYEAVCADMAQWVGRSSNDLIIQWGAPTKTYKFPEDKTMTVLEYKDSIRNYAGMRYKGMYAGQAKTTKYIKSFFTKDGIVVSYKYSIT